MRDARDQAGEDEEQQREDGGLAWFWVGLALLFVFVGFWVVLWVFACLFVGFGVFVFISVFVLGGCSISFFFVAFWCFFCVIFIYLFF